MSVFASKEALQEAFIAGNVPHSAFTRIVVNEAVFDLVRFSIEDGYPSALVKGAGGNMLFKWIPRGSMFIPDKIIFDTNPNLNESPVELVESAQPAASCELLPMRATIGSITLQAKYADVPSPQMHVPPEFVQNHLDHTTTKKLMMESKSVYLYEDTASKELIVPSMILDDGSVLHNVRVVLHESTCPHIILPLPNPHSS